ncbi:MAG: hypothetical protein ACHQIO_03615 [Nevskiales bacterium]
MSLLRRHVWLIVALAPIAMLYFRWTWSGEIGSLFNDGTSYLVMAQHYAPGHTADPVTAAAAFSRFPPLYPLLLAWSGAAFDLHLAHVLTTALLLLGLVALYAWMGRTGFSSAQAALLMLSFAALPGSWLAGLLIQSEYAYLLWSLLALALLSAYHEQRSDEWLLAAAIAVAAAALTRTAGITLLPPLLLAALRAGKRTALLSMAAALLPMLLWHTLHRTQGDGYGDYLAHSYNQHPWAFLQQQLRDVLFFLRQGFAQNLRQTTQADPLTDLVGLLCLAAAAYRAVRLKPDGVYVAAYGAVLLLWPYPGEIPRLLWVVLPVLLAQPILVIATWRGQAPEAAPGRLLTAICAAILMCMALPAISDAADRYRSAADSDLPGARGFESWYTTAPAQSPLHVGSELSLMGALREISDVVPQEGCVISVRPDWINYYAHRRSDLPPRNTVPDPQFAVRLRAGRCRYVFASIFVDSNIPIPMYPLQRIGDRFEVLQYSSMPGATSLRPLSLLATLH